MSPPLMREVKRWLNRMLALDGGDAIIDAPPGVSCPAVNAVMDSDVILLVTEPTPFGYYDLKLAHEAFGPLGKPMAVVVNRAGVGSTVVHDYCRATGLEILTEIAYDRRIAEAYANGFVLADTSTHMHKVFKELAARINTLAVGAGARKEAVHG